MKTITISIEDDIPDLVAIGCVQEVIRQGKISKARGLDFYCWATQLKHQEMEENVMVYTSGFSTPPNARFTILREVKDENIRTLELTDEEADWIKEECQRSQRWGNRRTPTQEVVRELNISKSILEKL